MRVYAVVFIDRILSYYERHADAQLVASALGYFSNMRCRVVEDSISEGPDHYKRRGPSSALLVFLSPVL